KFAAFLKQIAFESKSFALQIFHFSLLINNHILALSSHFLIHTRLIILIGLIHFFNLGELSVYFFLPLVRKSIQLLLRANIFRYAREYVFTVNVCESLSEYICRGEKNQSC